MELIGHVIDLFDDPEALGKSNENSKAYEVFFKQKPTLYHTDRVVLALATLAKMVVYMCVYECTCTCVHYKWTFGYTPYCMYI
eukprot:472798-Amorphochlora_amoeboformis.AAC.1